MAELILDGISTSITGIGTFFVNGFNAVAPIFYTPGVGEAPGELTFVGWLVVLAIGAGVVSSLLSMVFGLLGKIRIGRGRR